MKKSDIQRMPNYFDRYINLCDDVELIEGLEQTFTLFDAPDLMLSLQQLGDTVYAEGKWTAKDILQHLIDTERIISYRALRIARNDKTPLPGFEEDLFAQNTLALHRTIEDLIAEFKVVRQSSLALFRSFDEVMLQREGTSSNQPITALALGFIVMGHPIHHLNILKERYFSL